MAPPEVGKKYLIVFCKSCDKAFRVFDQPFGDGVAVSRPRGPLMLKCRGCGHHASYDPPEMRVAELGPKPERNRR